jgi:serine/threonine-protein kinase HipA
MSEQEPVLDVYLGNHLAGRLWLDARRRFVFRYEGKWVMDPNATPLSLSLPLKTEPYTDDSARPFFANLLPEGEIRRLIAQRFGLSEKNDFALLEQIGGECAGAVSLLLPGAFPDESRSYEELSEEEFHRIITELPRRPLLAGEKGIRLSLAGAQNKLPVFMEGDKVFIAGGNSPSTHILKPPIPGLDGTVENEAFCMTLAGRVGLPVPAVFIRKQLDTLLVVERYDRKKDPGGGILRLHQEDFCQALGILPDQKYESEGGPKLSQCFLLLRDNSTRPAADQRSLLSWVIFNALIGNADAHAKNLAILYAERGPRLAPFYDLLCTQIYPDLAEKYAMKIGGENRPDWLQLRHWERLADELSLKKRFVLDMIQRMTGMIVIEAEKLAEDFQREQGAKAIIEEILALIRKRAGSLP